MQLGIAFLIGFFIGGIVVHAFMRNSHLRTTVADEHYIAARRAVARHFREHGTLNLMEMERLMDINIATAMRYLQQLERDGIIKRQGNNRTAGIFYTAA